jgi:hypothetical protein
MTSRGNGKFACLGFVRGCLIGLAFLLIRFFVLWFVEWIIIKMSTKLLRSFPSISWQAPSMVPAYHSHLWDLSSLEQYFTLSLLTLRSSDYHAQDTPTEYLSTFCTCPYQLRAAFQETRSFQRLNFPLTKGLRHIVEIPPIFFFFLKKIIRGTSGW